MCAVEWKKLGDVCEILDSQRKPISKSKRVFGSYPYYGANGIQDYVDGYIFDGTYLLVGEDGSVINKDNSPVLHWVSGQFWVNNHAHILSDIKDAAILKYLYYVLHTIDVSDIVRGVPPKLNQENLKNIVIPIPPLAKQQEIVSHLETFTSLISNLESELDMRRKQYEHYRNQLLDFEGVEKLPLSEVFEMRGGYTPSTKNGEYWEDGTIPWFRMEDIRENGNILGDSTLHITSMAVKKNGLFPKNSIILATSATIGVHALLTVPALSNQRFTAFYPKEKFEDKVNYKYTYYVFYIIDEWCKNNTVQGGFASVDMTGLRKYLFPIPSLAKQAEIVSKLDAFENLIQSLDEEIKLRKQQYQYYREKLLTFE